MRPLIYHRFSQYRLIRNLRIRILRLASPSITTDNGVIDPPSLYPSNKFRGAAGSRRYGFSDN